MPKPPKPLPVFRPATTEQWRLNAVVGWEYKRSDLYALGYADAAQTVAEKAMQGTHQDLLIYPICFLYRHALEIAIKDLLRQTEHLVRLRADFEPGLAAERRPAADVETEPGETHSLERLFTRMVARLSMVAPDAQVPEDVRSAVLELHQMDPRGETFRYPYKRGVEQPTISQRSWLDIQRIVDGLGGAFRFLFYGVGGWLDAEIDSMNDYIGMLDQECEP